MPTMFYAGSTVLWAAMGLLPLADLCSALTQKPCPMNLNFPHPAPSSVLATGKCSDSLRQRPDLVLQLPADFILPFPRGGHHVLRGTKSTCWLTGQGWGKLIRLLEHPHAQASLPHLDPPPARGRLRDQGEWQGKLENQPLLAEGGPWPGTLGKRTTGRTRRERAFTKGGRTWLSAAAQGSPDLPRCPPRAYLPKAGPSLCQC